MIVLLPFLVPFVLTLTSHSSEGGASRLPDVAADVFTEGTQTASQSTTLTVAAPLLVREAEPNSSSRQRGSAGERYLIHRDFDAQRLYDREFALFVAK